MPTAKKNRNRLAVVGGLVAAAGFLLWRRSRAAASAAGTLPYTVTPTANYGFGGLIPLAPIVYNLGQTTSTPGTPVGPGAPATLGAPRPQPWDWNLPADPSAGTTSIWGAPVAGIPGRLGGK